MSTIATRLITPPDWTQDAVCAQIDPAVFYPRKGGSVAQAKAICATCPVVEQCLAWALDYEAGQVAGADWNSSHGVYGGLAAAERRVILRERAAALREAS